MEMTTEGIWLNTFYGYLERYGCYIGNDCRILGLLEQRKNTNRKTLLHNNMISLQKFIDELHLVYPYVNIKLYLN